MPNLLAGTRCPISCSADGDRHADTDHDEPAQQVAEHRVVDHRGASLSAAPREKVADPLRGLLPRPAVRGEHAVEVDPLGSPMGPDHVGHDVEDVQEAQPTGQERLHAHLVRRVVHARIRSAPDSHPPGERHRRERLVVQRRELPGRGRRDVDRAGGPGHPVGPAEGERDRQPHVRRRALGDARAVDELHPRVHDRLRVHDHGDPLQRHVEQTGAPRSAPAPCSPGSPSWS